MESNNRTLSSQARLLPPHQLRRRNIEFYLKNRSLQKRLRSKKTEEQFNTEAKLHFTYASKNMADNPTGKS